MILRGGKAPNYDAASVERRLQGTGSGQAAGHVDGRLQPCQQFQTAPKADSTWPRDIAAQVASGSRQRVRRDGREPPAAPARKSSPPGKDELPGRSNTARASPTRASAGTIRCRCSTRCRKPSRRAAAERDAGRPHSMAARSGQWCRMAAASSLAGGTIEKSAKSKPGPTMQATSVKSPLVWP